METQVFLNANQPVRFLPGPHYAAAVPFLVQATERLYGKGAQFDLSTYGGQTAQIWDLALSLAHQGNVAPLAGFGLAPTAQTASATGGRVLVVGGLLLVGGLLIWSVA